MEFKSILIKDTTKESSLNVLISESELHKREFVGMNVGT